MAYPAEAVETCEGDACSFTNPLARPFRLPGCEAELARLAEDARRIEQTTHDEARRTLRRLDALAAGGGTLWQRISGQKECDRVSVRPVRKGNLRFFRRGAKKEGAWEEEESVYSLEPLFLRALPIAHGSHWHSEVGGGGSGLSQGAPQPTPLHLTKNAFAIGPNWYFFRRAECEGAPMR